MIFISNYTISIQRTLNKSFCHLRFDKPPEIIWLTHLPQLGFCKPVKSWRAAIFFIFFQLNRIVKFVIPEHHLWLYRGLGFLLRPFYLLVLFYWLGLRRLSFCLFFESRTLSNIFMMFGCCRKFWLSTVGFYWVAL